MDRFGVKNVLHWEKGNILNRKRSMCARTVVNIIASKLHGKDIVVSIHGIEDFFIFANQ